MLRFPLTALATLLCLGACAPAAENAANPPADVASASSGIAISTAEVAPNTGRSVYQLSWSASVQSAPIRIEASADPRFAAGEGIVIADGLTEANFTWTAAEDAPRHYFLIIPEAGDPVRVSNRLLPLESGRNFRDMGGYQTADGQRVKWGELYRSGVMHELTPADYDYLSDLGIKVVCDLRTAQERNAEPTQWAAGEADYLFFPDPAGDDPAGFMSVFQSPDVTPEKVRDAMAGGYAAMAKEQAPAYREMFARLAAGEVPLAFNCSAGKDRTGIGAALILTALGVPEDTVIADYALSETYVDYMKEFAGSGAKIPQDSPYAFLAQLPPEVVAPLMRSDPYYLETALADLKAEHGSVIGFIQEELGVTDDMLAALRSTLLES